MRAFQLCLRFLLMMSMRLDLVHGIEIGTASPAPTESPAPSPSPSETPTDTQLPSVSLFPSTVPTLNPTTSKPSSYPSVEPTESPAPSPSPSETPTGSPTSAPSKSLAPSVSLIPTELPSELPTIAPSKAPSNNPTIAPTIEPSLSPSVSARPSVSANPTGGPIFVIASGNELVFVNTERKMDDETVEELEEVILTFFSDRLLTIQGATKVTFETVRVTDQFLQDATNRRLSSVELRVAFDVAALVLVENMEIFDYEQSISHFLKIDKHINELFKELVASSTFFDSSDVQVAWDESGVGGNDFMQTKEESGSADQSRVGQMEESKNPIDLAPTQKREMDVLLIISLISGCLLMVGATKLIFFQKRQSNLSSDSELSVSPYDDSENPFNFSTKRTETYDSNKVGDEESVVSDDAVPLKAFQSLKLQSVDSVSFQHSMYTPALIPTESNIEIPVTPMTNFEPSHFTPRGNTRYTPRSTANSTPDDMRTQLPGSRKTGVLGFGSFFPTTRFFTGRSELGDSDSRQSENQLSRHEAARTSEFSPGIEGRTPSNSLRIPEKQTRTSNTGRGSVETPSLLSMDSVTTSKERMSSQISLQKVNSDDINSPSRYSPNQGSDFNLPDREPTVTRYDVVRKVDKYVGSTSYDSSSVLSIGRQEISENGIKAVVNKDGKIPLPRPPRIGNRTDSAGRITPVHRRRPSGYISDESE